MTRFLTLTALVLACALAFGVGRAGAARTTYDANGTILVNGVKTFPIALNKPPPLAGRTPWGTDALDEVVGGGVTLLGAGPLGRDWNDDDDLTDAHAWTAAASARGVHAWIHLRELARAAPGTRAEERLRAVVRALARDPGLALWKTVDEPWWSGYPVTALEYSYALLKSLDSAHLSFVVQAPRGTPGDLAPYAAVADVHGVDPYPVGYGQPDPNLHVVGAWTEKIASVTPHQVVMTTLAICFAGSADRAGSGAFVLPTLRQARYMAYDAIMNGARALNFYGGHVRSCHAQQDGGLEWNWTYWANVLRPLLAEIGRRSRLYPVLLAPGSTLAVRSSDLQTPVIARRVGREVWLIAARWGRGSARVRFSGLPRSLASRGWVYREGGRQVVARGGAFTDRFSRWDVHVYRFRAR
jgi:hypothetical protein